MSKEGREERGGGFKRSPSKKRAPEYNKTRGRAKLTLMGVATTVVASRSQPLELHLSSQASRASAACFMTMGRMVRSNMARMCGLRAASIPIRPVGTSSRLSTCRRSQRNWIRTSRCLLVVVAAAAVPLPLPLVLVSLDMLGGGCCVCESE